MILATVYLVVITLTGTVVAPQNDEKDLDRFGIVWSHILQYRKGGVRLVFLILPSCILRWHQEYFQCNVP